ncbi:hypothetical protein B0H14DRAFT_3441881 [Mycena olivaceomarginata]|nr:hypothetical protein B0H14DRAFT_3441881 [Mycena olivaceomarginata]
MPHESVTAYCRHFEHLLLSDEEFQNLSWEPSGCLEEFCREKLRPALLLVHQCTLEGTDPRVISTDIPSEEKDKLRLVLLRLVGTTRFLLRARLTRSENMRIPELAHHVPAAQITAAMKKYRVPRETADLFVLMLLAFDRGIDGRGEDRKALGVGYSILMDLYEAASEQALEDGCPTDFTEFRRGKDLRLDVPLEEVIPAELLREDDACAQAAAQMAALSEGEVVYVQSFLRPFAHVIRSAIPSTVYSPDDMPFGRAAELEKYVVAYLEQAAVLYAISFEAITFDYFLGKPIYGYVPNARESFLSRISLAANLANKARGPSSALDVQLMPDFASLPQLINNWACENALLEDGIEQTQNFGRALEKSATYADMGYGPNPSSRYFIFTVGQLDGVLSTGARLAVSTLVVPFHAVVIQAHTTKAGLRDSVDLHHTTCIIVEEEIPEETIALIRNAVSMLLKNMVALGKASLKYGSFDNANPAGYFVPPEGTTLFGMAECFVDLYGYHGDASPFNRALMFDNLNTLYCTMVLDEGYLRFGIDFPNFDVSKADPERYGIYEFIKPQQITRLSSEDPGTVVHQFGDRLLRYNPKLGDKARYQFPDPSREYAATQPDTLVLSPVAEVADESMEEEEDSDKENESL